MKQILPLFLAILLWSHLALAEPAFQRDIIPTNEGEIALTFLGHGSLMIAFKGRTIHVDPYSRLTDYGALPPADLVLITHHHGDHLDTGALSLVTRPNTLMVMTATCAQGLAGALVMNNGDKRVFNGITVEAVPAYNLVHRQESGELYHPKGIGNGYILSLANKRIYIAGDTENTPEMKALKAIDIAFLPMNLPYTMTPKMVADAARAFKPKILYPYHYGETDPNTLIALLKGTRVEVRIRDMK